ncbi:hypothetical protein HD553DRAFT_333314 [Filobasidium floriforme]|uniref:uncharacterized protein n=1 Tax=Filobasidium floriforme TaxID=5210 RepID=UPI001E8EDA06|nr:uncharacterized protein HD553DRAFT_333314 [Filobasidium floriforme]KAH8090961.1 hypothetical protein HD553DRAFT_333314 [Filobasidium floriforme]
MATSFSFSSQPINYRQSRDVVVGWIRPQQNLVHRPLSSNSPASRYTPYPQPQLRPQSHATPHPQLTTSQPLNLVPSTSRFNPRSPTRPLFSHKPAQLQTSPGSRERKRLRSSTPPAPPLIPLGCYRPTAQGSLTRDAFKTLSHRQPRPHPQSHSQSQSQSHAHQPNSASGSQPQAHPNPYPQRYAHCPPQARNQIQSQKQLHSHRHAHGGERSIATSIKSTPDTLRYPPLKTPSVSGSQTTSASLTISTNPTSSSATPTISSNPTTSSNPTNSKVQTTSFIPSGSGSQPMSPERHPAPEPRTAPEPHRAPQVGQTVPTQSSFLCVFQYKTERVQAIGADDLATTLQSLPCIFPALAAYQPEEVTLYGIVPQFQARSPSTSPAVEPASSGIATRETSTTTSTTAPSTSKSLCFRMTPGLYAELRKAHRSVYSDPTDHRDENRTQQEMGQQERERQRQREGAMRAISWFIVVTSEQVSGNAEGRKMAGLQDDPSDGNGGNTAGGKMEMKLHLCSGGSGKDGKAAKGSRQNEDGKKASTDGTKQRSKRAGELDRVAEREQQAEHRSSAPSPAFPARVQSPVPTSCQHRMTAPADLDRSSEEDKPIQVQPESMHIGSDNHSRDENDPLDLVPPKGYTDRAGALEALRGLSLLWKKSPVREIVPLGEVEVGEDTQREVECQSDDLGEEMETGVQKEAEVEPKTAVETSSAMAVDDQLELELQAAPVDIRRSQTPTSPAPIVAVESAVKQEDKTPPATPLKCMVIDQITPPHPPVLYKVNTKNTIILTATTTKKTASADPFTVDVHLQELVNPAPTIHMKPNPKPKKREKKKALQRTSTVVLPMSDRTNLPYRPMIQMSKSEKRLQASLQAAFGGKGLVQEATRG